ncbi:hypothetical protein ACQP10_38470 (plasmid) [Streptosporangium sandarakinum]|uniref:hypothetical protein n=1 Tax=Streptosporangium sandarakinum TaxID=1260955 RepID=UPI003D92C63F
MIPIPGTPASDQLQQIAQWGPATRVLNQLQAMLTDYEVPFTFVREDGQPRLLIGESLTVWTGYSAEVIYWGPELGRPAKLISSCDLADVARRIAEQARAASAV